MRRRSEIRLIVGVLIWIGLISGLFLLIKQGAANPSDSTRQLASYFSQPVREVELEFQPGQIMRVGDPIFWEVDGKPKLVGRIHQVKSKDFAETTYVYADKAYARLFGNAPELDAIDGFTFHSTSESFDWIVQTMLPPETRDEINKLILKAYRENQGDIYESFKPVVENSLRETSRVIRRDLAAAFAKRESRFSKIGARLQDEMVGQKIVPLVQEEIWPIVQTEAEPLLREVGGELWREVSIWRFTWKALYDASPLPEKKLAQKEFDKFISEKGSPILEAHFDEFLEVQKSILAQVMANEKVKEVVSQSAQEVIHDQEIQELLTEVFQEVFSDNQELRTVFEESWATPEAQNALAKANEQLEPTVTEIGSLLFGTLDGEIASPFKRVLRNRILNKDERWLRIKASDTKSDIGKSGAGRVFVVKPGSDSEQHPLGGS